MDTLIYTTKPLRGKEDTIEDFKDYEKDFKLVSFDDILATINKEKDIIFLDTETTGLEILDTEIIMFQVYNPKTDLAIAVDIRDITQDQFKELFDICNSYNMIVGANLAFDYNKLKNHDLVITTRTYDVLLAKELMELGKFGGKDRSSYTKKHGFGMYSLAGLVNDLLGKEMDKGVRNNFASLNDKPFSAREFKYGLKDAYILYDVMKELIRMQAKDGYVKKYKVGDIVYDDITFESEHSLCLADLEYNGMYLDQKQWLSNRYVFIEEAKELEDKLAKEAIKSGYPATKGLFGNTIDINWASASQVLKFFSFLGIQLKDSQGKASAGRAVLEKVDHPIAKLVVDYRKAKKNITTYGQKFLKDHVQKDGRIRSKYNRIVSTGRISSRSPNLQNIPSLPGFRKAFIGEGNNYLKTGDYSQQEKRVDVQKTKDSDGIEFYNHGHGDMHSFTASKMLTIMKGHKVEIPPKKENDPEAMAKFKAHPDKDFRSRGKTINFLLDYGGGPKGLSLQFGISLKEAKDLFNIYFKAFPAKKAYFSKMQSFALRNGFVYLNDLSSIRRYFPEFERFRELMKKNRLTGKQKREMMMLEGSIKRKAINTPTQGTAAMMTKAASVIERRILINKHGIRTKNYIPAIYAIAVVHDEKVQEGNSKKTLEKDSSLKQAMEQAGKIFIDVVPCPAYPVVEKHWTH